MVDGGNQKECKRALCCRLQRDEISGGGRDNGHPVRSRLSNKQGGERESPHHLKALGEGAARLKGEKQTSAKAREQRRIY